MIKLTVEVADNPISLAQGLMWRKDLNKDHGMLFKFNSPTTARFWGKNTYLPLDLAFVDGDNKISEITSIVPMSTKMVNSASGSTKMAIEANYGFFKKHNIGVNNVIVVGQTDDKTTITFEKKC